MNNCFVMSDVLDKKNCTYSVGVEVQRDFKAECARNGISMSEVLTDFMTNYIRLSREIAEEKYKEKTL